ncbi:MAG: translation initiation factor IF-2 N-terminal domain-containing protein, partial [Sedimentisphaerales bacterium]
MAITRVYLLARELGVNSTAILKKCQDEGLDVKNHMTTISAGLAATIREWFSEGEHSTTVETAEKVNLEKVRVKKTRGKKPPVAEPEEQIPAGEEIELQAIALTEPIQTAPPAAPPVTEPLT